MMYCQNCGSKLDDQNKYCTNCGCQVRNLPKVGQIGENLINKQVIQQNMNLTMSTQLDNYKNMGNTLNYNTMNGQKKSSTAIIIGGIIIFLVVFFILVIYMIFNMPHDKKKNNDDNKEQVEETVKLNSLDKLKNDYNSGKIDVNTYFTQLVYLEFNSDKLQGKYRSDYEFYLSDDELETDSILEKYYDKLDEATVKYYLKNKMLANVTLGKKRNVTNANNVSYQIRKLDEDNNQENASQHNLNRVSLSSNGHFLIWYADSGSDAITDSQLKEISDGLEKSIEMYEQNFKINYSYSPYVDNKLFNDDWKNAKEVLEDNAIPTTVLKTAMSVYVYETGSEYVLASYNNYSSLAKMINRSLFLDVLDQDGIVNYPYIIINKDGIKNNESLSQLYNHELFHHMQYLYCQSKTGQDCVNNLYFKEGMANFASSLASSTNGNTNFLNNWAAIYTKNTSTKLSEITDGNSFGYAIFPYFYAYSLNNSNWASVLMEAHNQNNPLDYIQKNTSKDILIATINTAALSVLNQNYDNHNLLANPEMANEVTSKLELDTIGNNNIVINPGAIDYYKLNKKANLKVNIQNSEYVTINLYGLKDGKYIELKSSNKNLEIEETIFNNYSQLYLVVTNGDLINTYNYTIDVSITEYVENNNYETTFNNYNIELIVNGKASGMDIQQHSKGVVDEVHQKEYLEVETTTMGIPMSSRMYYDFNSGYTYMTQPYGGDVWYKSKENAQRFDLGKILTRLKDMKNVTKISDDHFKIKMTPQDMKGLMVSSDTDTSAIKGNVDVDVYTKNNYIVKLEYDLTNLLPGFDYYKVTANFSNHNQAGDVNIPKDIVDNAKEM